MSDELFEPPGGSQRPDPAGWIYDVPSPEEQTPTTELTETMEAGPAGPRRNSPIATGVVFALLGALMGAGIVGFVTRTGPEPQPVPITVDTFPREVLGVERNDLELRRAGFGPTIARLDAEFEAQLAAFRFSYEGDGATFGYGWLIDLTVVNGILASEVPREGELDMGGKARQPRRLVSLQTGTTSCTFEPRPSFSPSSGVDDLGDFSSFGRTQCVLRDRERNLSLRLNHNGWARNSNAFETAREFRDELERLHAQLLS